MEIEKLIEDTFKAHEHVAPDSDAVLASARQRIDRRRAISRPLAVAAGVAVLSVAAAAVVALNRPGPAPDDKAQVAAPTGETQVDTAPPAPAIGELTMPFTLGWLPEGEVEYVVRRINTGATAEEPDKPLYGGEYMLTVTKGGQVLTVDVQQFKMTDVDDAAFKSGPGNPLTIGGQPAVESSVSDGPGGYELYVADSDGGSMYVHVSIEYGSTAPAQQLIETGRKIGENIRFPGTTTVTPSFGLGDLPDGTRMCTFDVEKPFDPAPLGSESSTSYTLGTCTSVETTIVVSTTNENGVRGAEGEPVQGHETRFIDEGGYRSLWILDAVGDAPVLVAGSVPAADLYAIANGLVLPAE